MRNKLLMTLALIAVLVTAFLVTAGTTATAAVFVPDCDCTIHNYPNPGDTLHGVRKSGECFADPCATAVE